jgi:hypothetical protein
MLAGVDSEPGSRPGRQQEIDARLEVLRVRLKELRERDWDAVRSRAAAPSDRLEAAQRHAAQAAAAAAQLLTASAEAFGNTARAHERVAIVHDRAAAAGIGDVRMHEEQAALHRAAAAADRQRAERVLSLLSDPEQAEPADVCDEPGDGVAR